MFRRKIRSRLDFLLQTDDAESRKEHNEDEIKFSRGDPVIIRKYETDKWKFRKIFEIIGLHYIIWYSLPMVDSKIDMLTRYTKSVKIYLSLHNMNLTRAI